MNKVSKKTWIIVVMVISIVVLLGFSTLRGYNVVEKYLDALKVEKQEAIEKVKDSMFIEIGILQYEKDSITAIKDIKIPSYYYSFKKSENEKQKLINYILGLSDNVYTQQQLDSLAEHYKY